MSIESTIKFLKHCNKKRHKITLGIVISFLLSSTSLANQNFDNFSEIKDLFKSQKRIEKKLPDGKTFSIFFNDNKLIIEHEYKTGKETYAIVLSDLYKLDKNVAHNFYYNLVKILENLKNNDLIINDVIDVNNENLLLEFQTIKTFGINNGIIDSFFRGQLIENGLGINNGFIKTSNGQDILSSGLGINNGIIDASLHGQYISFGKGINNGIIKSKGNGQTIDSGIGINNNIIESNNNGQLILNSLGINNETIESAVGQNITDYSIGFNNGFIKGNSGQNISNSIGINSNYIFGEVRGQSILEGLGINIGTIYTTENTASQDINGVAFNNNLLISEGIGQLVNSGVAINNGVIKGVAGQSLDGLGRIINNGIIIAKEGFFSQHKSGNFYRNGIVLDRDTNGKLILNNQSFVLGKDNIPYNNIKILNDLNTNNNFTQVVGNKVVVGLDKNNSDIKGHKIFINNLDKNNTLILNTSLSKNSYLGRDYSHTHITTAVSKDSTLNDSVIKVKNNENNFSMENSTIVGYFEKNGTLLDMSESKIVQLNNSVITGVGENNIDVTTLKLNSGSELTLNNSSVNGNIIFENTNSNKTTTNMVNLNSKYLGVEISEYKDESQPITNIGNIKFNGKSDDSINIKVETGKSDNINKSGKGFVFVDTVDFGNGKDSLNLNFDDFKDGHFNIINKINFGEDSEEDILKFSSKLNMNREDLAYLNILLSKTENLDTIQLSDDNNNIILGENGLALNFSGNLNGGKGNDKFSIFGNKNSIFNLDGGEGENSLIIGEKNTSSSKDISSDYIVLNGKISNFKNLDINTDLKLNENAEFSNVSANNINLNNHNIILDIEDKKDKSGKLIGHALYNKNQDIKFENTGNFIFDVVDFNNKVTIDMGNFNLKENAGTTNFVTNSSVHKITTNDDGTIFVDIIEDIPGFEPLTYYVIPNYNYLNKIYKSIVDADKINQMNLSTSLNNKTKNESIMAQLDFYGKIFNSTPYAYSNKVSKKSILGITNEILDSNIKTNEKEWNFGGKILGQNSENKNEFYGKNLHQVDVGNSEVKSDIRISGAYGYGEYGLSKSTSLGFVIGGTKSKADISGGSKLKGNSLILSTYVKKDIASLELKTGFGYEKGYYDSTRVVSNSYQKMITDKNYNDDTFFTFAGAKYSYPLEKDIFLEPYTNIIFSYVKQDNIIEDNSNSLNIDVEGKSFSSIDSELGVDVSKKINISHGKLNLKAGTSLVYTLDGYENEYLTGKIKGSSKSFDILSPESNKSKIKFKLSGEYQLENGISYSLNGDYSYSSDNKDYKIGVGIGYKF